jgi:hypothetical protein
MQLCPTDDRTLHFVQHDRFRSIIIRAVESEISQPQSRNRVGVHIFTLSEGVITVGALDLESELFVEDDEDINLHICRGLRVAT